MNFTIAIVIFFFGLCIGSFLNVVLIRFRTNSLFKKADSFCLACATPLKNIDLIPLVSFYLLRGRCRACGSKFSSRYFWVELFTALLFVGSYYLFGLTLEAGLFASLFVSLILITFYDLKHMVVPDEFSIPWNVLSLLTMFIAGNSFTFDIPDMLNHLGAGVGMFLFFTFLWWVTKGRGMGFADGIIALGIGFVLGFPLSITALLLSFWIGAAISIAYMLLSKVGTSSLVGRGERLTMKSEVPFGPYLAIGFLITLFTNVSLFF